LESLGHDSERRVKESMHYQMDSTSMHLMPHYHRIAWGRRTAVVTSRQSLLFALCLALAVAAPLVEARACPPADCLRGKTISLIVGYGAGGGYDAYARLIAPELERRIGTAVVVRNRPGAGGLIALNDLARTAGDGLTLGVVNVAAAVVAQGLATEAVRYDIGMFPWLAGIGFEQRALIVAADRSTPPWDIKRSASSRVRWAAGGPSDEMAVNAALLSEALGLSSRIVTGYKGTNEAVLGLIRGEADAVVISADTARQYANTRAIKAIALMAYTRSPLFPDTPTIFETVTHDRSDPMWLRLLIDLSSLGRGLIAPPGTPHELAAYLRSALHDVLTEDGFLRRAKAAGREIDYRPPGELGDRAAAALGALRSQRELQHVLLEKYY
jgi:tripartite-type tricarboxylate transporter receptor subunit TctC